MQQVFTYVKNLWPRYDTDGNGTLGYDEARPFVREVLGPMLGRDKLGAGGSDDESAVSEGTLNEEMFTESEYK